MSLSPDEERKAQEASWKTAIARDSRYASQPLTWLTTMGRLHGRVLDYGCGRGTDATWMATRGNVPAITSVDRWDPHFEPGRPERGLRGYDVITCTYVLNVLPPSREGFILDDIFGLLCHLGGEAFISVRRDVVAPGFTENGTYQQDVRLRLASIYLKKGCFEIYKMRRPA